jgi:hypothetical protein
LGRWKRARVNIDYHVELDGHFYSVPHRLVSTEVQLRITATTIEVFAGKSARRLPCPEPPARRPHHGRRTHAGVAPGASTVTPQRLIAWGERIGAATARVVR